MPLIDPAAPQDPDRARTQAERTSASEAKWNAVLADVAKSKRRRLVIAWSVVGAAVLAMIVAGLLGGFRSTPTIRACMDAQTARSLANSLSNEHDRGVAALQYAVKKAECEAQGGTVP